MAKRADSVITGSDITRYRESTGMSQREFAEAFDLPLSTLRKWEQQVSEPQISLAKLNMYNAIFGWKKRRPLVPGIEPLKTLGGKTK